MSQETRGGSVRPSWLLSVVAQCQLFVGDAILLIELGGICRLASEFSARLPAPESELERLVLRALLIELAIRWGTLVHAQVHNGKTPWRCAFTPTRALDRVWSRGNQNPVDGFLDWARAFSTELTMTHPRSAAQRVEVMLHSPTWQPMGVADLAALVGVTPKQLRRAFRRRRGIALPEYLRRARLVRALQTLVAERDKIEPVALGVGYGGRKRFYRHFKQLTGMTPRQFRQLPAGAAHQIIEDTKLALLRDCRRAI